MHTTGEPTRIIFEGFPDLKGTLLEQREEAKNNYDHLRNKIMLEPRGHFDMYGALLCPKTELVDSGKADMGVLFMHNDGSSTMCGHATIALGRFLVDTSDERVLPNRSKLKFDLTTQTIQLRLHAPCGIVLVTVPTNSSGTKSDATKPISFLSTPSFVAATNLVVKISPTIRWKELGKKDSIQLDISYRGAFYAIVSAKELGFKNGLREMDLSAIKLCINKLKPFLTNHPLILNAIKHHNDDHLAFLYSIMIVDDKIGRLPPSVNGSETGLCFFR